MKTLTVQLTQIPWNTNVPSIKGRSRTWEHNALYGLEIEKGFGKCLLQISAEVGRSFGNTIDKRTSIKWKNVGDHYTLL